MFVAWIFSSVFAHAHAHLDAEYAQRLSRATSPTSIRRVTRQFEELKIARLACRQQIRQKHSPLACYQALAREMAWGLHPHARTRLQLRARLDELCERAAHQLKVPRTLGDLSEVTPRCRQNVAQARKIQEYRAQPEWSEN